MNNSTWPFDFLQETHQLDRVNPNELIVFLASPFRPEEKYGKIYSFCKQVCEQIGNRRQVKVVCQRGDHPFIPDIIHNDIWNYIEKSDAIIIDISAKNMNVWMELGVAAALRKKNNVILIKDQKSKTKIPFDISPARILLYQEDILFEDSIFLNKLLLALEFALTPAPFIPETASIEKAPVKGNPLNLLFTDIASCNRLIGPSNSHRQITPDGLEFGSFYIFQYSWLSLGTKIYANVHVKAEMKFTSINPDISTGRNTQEPWMGISLRSQLFYSNCGHLFYIRIKDGKLGATKPKSEYPSTTELFADEFISLQKSPIDLHKLVEFDLTFTDKELSANVNGYQFNPLDIKAEHNYTSGLIRFQTNCARACAKSAPCRTVIPGYAAQ